MFSRFEDADTSGDAPQFKYRFLVKPGMCRLSLRILLEGFLPTHPRSAKKKLKEMDEGAALDEDLLQVMLLSFFFFKKGNGDRYDISCISACLDDTGTVSLPGGKYI